MPSILVTLDDSAISGEIIPVAAKLAEGLKARVLLLTIVEPVAVQGPGPDVRETVIGGHTEDAAIIRTAPQRSAEASVNESLAQEARSRLESVASRLRASGLAVETEVLTDSRPADAVIAYATKQQPDFIAMATHGHSGLRDLVQGSVASAVVRSGVAPVLLVRPKGQ
jgi:nucleotide-binding universal stress UspA family protein